MRVNVDDVPHIADVSGIACDLHPLGNSKVCRTLAQRFPVARLATLIPNQQEQAFRMSFEYLLGGIQQYEMTFVADQAAYLSNDRERGLVGDVQKREHLFSGQDRLRHRSTVGNYPNLGRRQKPLANFGGL